MGRTIKTTTNLFFDEIKALGNFRHALRKADARALDALMDSAHERMMAISNSAYPIPIAMILLTMVIELHRKISRLESKIENIKK